MGIGGDIVEGYGISDNINIDSSAVIAVDGPNFSGRSAYLENLSWPPFGERQHVRGNRKSYLGPDVPNYLSGLLPTVSGELALHGYASSPRRSLIQVLLEVTNLLTLMHHNPLTLSGGQQVILALSTALLSTEQFIAIDCMLEQLSASARGTVLGVLAQQDLELSTILADNRLREFKEHVTVKLVPTVTPPMQARPATIQWLPITPTAPAPKILLDAISFGYSSRRAVIKDLSYQFKPGVVYFLHGPNGVGKSTLGKLMCGLLKPAQGTFVLGDDAEWDPCRRPGEIVAYHFQNPDFQLFSTRVSDQFDTKAAAVTSSFGLEPYLHSHPHDLPFVLRKRVAIAMTIARRRPWMLLDEPILGQDDQNARVLAQILAHAAREGSGVIVFSHSQWFKSLFDVRVTLEMSASELREIAA